MIKKIHLSFNNKNKVWCSNCEGYIKTKSLLSKKVTNHIKSIKHIKNSVIDTL